MSAAQIVTLLPPGTVFGVEVTNEDNMDEPSVLNIFAKDHEDRVTIAALLKFTDPVDDDSHYISWRAGALLVSITEPTDW